MPDYNEARARQALLVVCPVCAAQPREQCRRLLTRVTDAPLRGPHSQRCVEASIHFATDDERYRLRRLRRL